MEKIGVFLHQLHRLQFFQDGFFGDLVFTLPSLLFKMTGIRDVTNIPYLIAKMAQVAVDNIEGDEWPGMPEMAFPTDGWSAYIHANPAWNQRTENFFLPGE